MRACCAHGVTLSHTLQLHFTQALTPATQHTYHPHRQACLLENLRFHAGEVNNDTGFAQQLAALADVYVSDAFAVCHRQQASVTVGVDPQPLRSWGVG